MKVGQYKIVRTLGQGGMAKILLALTPTGENVVLKVPLKKDPEQLERLRDEARIGQTLKHSSIVETLGLLDEGARPILVVEYVRGVSLSQLRRLGPLPPSVVARAGRQIAEGLVALHEATDAQGRSLDILHRDVTGGNILLDDQGNAKLIDLGIARSEISQAKKTRLGVVRGTLRYLAPELLLGGAHNQATDVWSLGVTLWEAVLGRRALDGEQDQVMRDIRDIKLMQYRDGENVDSRMHDAIAAILAAPESRLQKAKAVAAVFGRLEKVFSNGQQDCISAVEKMFCSLPAEDKDISEETRKFLCAAWGENTPAEEKPALAGFDFDDEETVRRAPLKTMPRDALRSDQAPTREGQAEIPVEALRSQIAAESPSLQPSMPSPSLASLSAGGAAATLQMAAHEFPEAVQQVISANEKLEKDVQQNAPAPISSLGRAPVVESLLSSKKTQALHGDVLKRALADAPVSVQGSSASVPQPGFVEQQTEIITDRNGAQPLEDDLEWKPKRTGLYGVTALLILGVVSLGVYAAVDVFFLSKTKDDSIATKELAKYEDDAVDAGLAKVNEGLAKVDAGLAKEAVIVKEEVENLKVKKKKKKKKKKHRKHRFRKKRTHRKKK